MMSNWFRFGSHLAKVLILVLLATGSAVPSMSRSST